MPPLPLLNVIIIAFGSLLGSATGSDGGRFAHTHSANSGNRSGSRCSLDEASAGSVGTVGSSNTSKSGGTDGGGREQSVFERLQVGYGGLIK